MRIRFSFKLGSGNGMYMCLLTLSHWKLKFSISIILIEKIRRNIFAEQYAKIQIAISIHWISCNIWMCWCQNPNVSRVDRIFSFLLCVWACRKFDKNSKWKIPISACKIVSRLRDIVFPIGIPFPGIKLFESCQFCGFNENIAYI